MLSGVPDLFLPVPRNSYHGLYIEMKSEKGAYLLVKVVFICYESIGLSIYCVLFERRRYRKNKGIFKNVTHG